MVCLDYPNQPSTDWVQLLTDHQLANETIMIPVLWGPHEKLRGVIDFAKTSRLRLEKLLSLAHQQKCSIQIQLGFNGDERSFPDWTKSLSPQAAVPLASGLDPLEIFQTGLFPSLNHPDVREGFLNFVDEALGIISLYCSPQGPVESIRFSWGPHQFDSSLMDPDQLCGFFQGRYGSISSLNSLYQSSFKDFETVCTKMGIRTLFDKRPWIAASDFKNGRSGTLKEIQGKIQERFEKRGIGSWFVVSDCFSFLGPHQVVIDDMLIESFGQLPTLLPLTIFGQIVSSTVSAFRFAESIKLEALQRSETIGILGQWIPSSELKATAVLTQKFIQIEKANQLNDFASRGGSVLFPLGLPQWDENLNLIKWSHSTQRDKEVCESEEFWVIRKGKGKICYPIRSWDPSSNLYCKSSSFLQKASEELSCSM